MLQVKRKIYILICSICKIDIKKFKYTSCTCKNQKELSNFVKKNLISDEIVIGMGAGSISQWMRELEFTL